MKIMEIISMLEKCLNEGAHDVIHGGIKVEGNTIGSGGKYMLQGGSSSEIVYPIAGHYHIRGISPNEGRRMARALGKNVPDNPGIELGEGVRVEEDLINIPNDFETRRGVLFCSPQFGDTPEEESFAFYRDIKKVRQSWMTTAGYTIARNGNIIFLDMVTYSSPNYSDSKPGVIRAEIEDKGTHFEVAKISRW